MGRSLWGESTIEKAFFYLLELDANVTAFQPQPLQIQYTHEGKGRVYTPDVLVTYSDGSKTIFEVKQDRVADSPEWQFRYRLYSAICAESGYNFRLARESEILYQPRFNNLRFLFRYSRVATGVREQVCCQKIFTSGRAVSIREAKEHFRRCGISETRLFALICQGFLSIDINEPFTSGSSVWWAGANSEVE